MKRLSKSQLKTMDEIFEMWEYHMFQKVDALDHMIRHIMTEMNVNGIPTEVAINYLQAKFADMVEQCAERTTMGRGKSAGRGISA